MDSRKSNKIREIVRLQQILKKWRKLATTSKPDAGACTNGNININGSKSIKFLKITLSVSDNNNNNNSSVPKGYLAVCVGEEQKRFIIPTEYLSHQAFHILLRKAEEEFGFQQAGVLRIPCQVSIFECVLKMVEEKQDFMFFMQDSIGMGYCASELQGPTTPSHHPQSPMCR